MTTTKATCGTSSTASINAVTKDCSPGIDRWWALSDSCST